MNFKKNHFFFSSLVFGSIFWNLLSSKTKFFIQYIHLAAPWADMVGRTTHPTLSTPLLTPHVTTSRFHMPISFISTVKMLQNIYVSPVLDYVPPQSNNPAVLNFLIQKVWDCHEKKMPVERFGTITDYKNIFLPLLTELTCCSQFPEFSFGHIRKLGQWRCCRITDIGLLTVISSAIDEFC